MHAHQGLDAVGVRPDVVEGVGAAAAQLHPIAPVGYLEISDAVVILVNDAPSKTWWRNYLDGGPIDVLLRGTWQPGKALTLAPDSDEFRRCADESFRQSRAIPRLFGIAFDPQSGLSLERRQALRVLLRRERQLDLMNPWGDR